MNIPAAEADLARRDPDVPGLATVLDPDAFAAAVRRAAPHADVRRGRILYLRYKPRALCRLSYRLDVGGEPVELDVRACRREDVGPLLSEADAEAVVPGPLGSGRLLLEDHAVVITVFPNDLKLLTLRFLARADERRRVLQESLPDRPDLWDGELRRLGYRPERRFVAEVRADGNGKRTVLKAYTRKAYQRGKHNVGAFASGGPLRLARLLGCSDRRRLLAFEWLPGNTLLEHLAAPALDGDVVAGAGAALATLHDLQPDGLTAWTRRDEVAAVAGVAAEIGFVSPPLARRAELLARRIETDLASAPPLQLPMHGDFSAAQVLVAPHAGGRVAIIDLDWSCRGDPADDLGNLIGQAERQVLDGAHSPSWREYFIAALLDGYRGATARPLPDRVGLYTALSLFRRARHPFRTREADWPLRTEMLLERAEAIVQESGRGGHRDACGLGQ